MVTAKNEDQSVEQYKLKSLTRKGHHVADFFITDSTKGCYDKYSTASEEKAFNMTTFLFQSCSFHSLLDHHWSCWRLTNGASTIPDSKVHGANMGPIWGRQDPGGPHAGPMNFAKVHGATWGPSGADRTQVGPMLAPWTLLSGNCYCRDTCWMTSFIYQWLSIRALSQYKDSLTRYGDFHVKDKMVETPFYL